MHQTSRVVTRIEGRARLPDVQAARVSPRTLRALRCRMSDEDLVIGPAEAGRLVQAGEAILIDVVESGAWGSLREVPAGSLRVPPVEFRARVAELPLERTLITYCT